MKKIKYKDFFKYKTRCPYDEIKSVGALSCYNCSFYIGHSKQESAIYCIRNEFHKESLVTSPRLLIVERKLKFLRKNFPRRRLQINLMSSNEKNIFLQL